MSNAAFAGGFVVGNGGDYVRGTFFKVGEAVTNYLTNSSEGQALVAANGLNVDALKATLTIDRVKVSPDKLRDNGGSLVDALGENGAVTLSNDPWTEHFEKNRDVYYLVFHEMLRSAGVNDDSFAISKSINPFPDSFRIVTLLKTLVPLIAEDNLASALDLANMDVRGTGCPADTRGTRVEFDEENNRLEISTRRYTMASSEGHISRKNCAFVIPVAVPAGKRIVFSQVDMNAVLDLKSGADAHLQFEAFTAGTSGDVKERDYSGPKSGRTLIRKSDAFTTACGANTNLRLNTSANIVSNERNSTVDVEKITVDLKLEDCN
jgi:hypothetical protein